MCHLDLKNPEVLRKIRDVWKEELESVRDERRRWAQGWTRVKSVLKEARKDRDKKKREEGALAEELAWRRDNLTNDLTAAEVDTLAALEKRAKEQDLHEAKIWRIRSRERWLSVDEAPTRYFFTKLRAKWAQEAVEALEVNGDEVTDHEDILSEIHKFYAELFQAEAETEERRAAQEEVVGLITKRLSPADSNHLSRMPDKEEIEGVVFKMKTDKASGADGLTIEVMKISWEWLGEDCVRMIQTVWTKKRILKTDCEGLIRLVLPQLVDVQQTGFVMGRKITDNILSVKIGQEWAEWSSQQALFVKLDFIKAYDRVDHAFLWRTLECQGFDQEFISLVQGITREGLAQVHVNAAFTKEIKVSRGVRQGCPLAPLLYALYTHAFMSLLCKANRENRIGGLFIQPGAALGHQLFADDTGICIKTREEDFEELKKVLMQYELASGAKINLAKSLIMPLGAVATPQWVAGTGCVVAGPGDSFKYLGVRIGVQLAEGVRFQAIIIRMKEKIFRWENALLSWRARALLIKHVLSQIPTPKHLGGLGFLSFESRAKALQMRHVSDLLEGEGPEWVLMAHQMIAVKVLMGPHKLEKRWWGTGEAMLLLPALRFPEAQTLDRLLQNPGMLLLVYEYTWLIWKERNAFVFYAKLAVADAKEMIKLTMASANVVISKLSGRNAMSTEGAIRVFLDKAEVELSKAKERQAQVRVILDEIDGWDSGSEILVFYQALKRGIPKLAFPRILRMKRKALTQEVRK
ncbi:hypothetical protein R1sor_019525 [Riccia sorocarpa]|uniref:Reverse transcriptase domain-containing protein n=1 Tax=Riccia sorocarpa TaxID=122646 RepID=A0ABD3ICS2_9MARC